jgi:hypothetical protein
MNRPRPLLGHVVPPSVLVCKYSATVPVAEAPGAAVKVTCAPRFLAVPLLIVALFE